MQQALRHGYERMSTSALLPEMQKAGQDEGEEVGGVLSLWPRGYGSAFAGPWLYRFALGLRRLP